MDHKPAVQPLDPPMTPFAVGGMAIWAIAAVIMSLIDSPAGWTGICVAGVVMGTPGLIAMIVHDRNRTRRRAPLS